jgi:PKD repeat protein
VVEISFSASEALDGLPSMTINGKAGLLQSQDNLDYVYAYTVQADDANGAATLLISGSDLAGNSGQTEDATTLVIDHAKPTANFSATPRSGMPPLEATFTDQSVPVSGTPITDWAWDFGDGTPVASGQTPAPHTYAAPGIYTATLTVTDSAMNSDSESKVDYIVVGGPTADFTATPASGSAPLLVQFTDASHPGAMPITAWHWTFGDGATSAEPNPSHLYAMQGTYSVSLTVTTALTSDTISRHDLITAAPGVAPSANFSATPTGGAAPLTVHFTDASDPGTAPIEHWHWDFGDGNVSQEEAPVHVYIAPGTYAVSLTVTTTVATDTTTRYGYIQIFVAMPVAAMFTIALLAVAASVFSILLIMKKSPLGFLHRGRLS